MLFVQQLFAYTKCTRITPLLPKKTRAKGCNYVATRHWPTVILENILPMLRTVEPKATMKTKHTYKRTKDTDYVYIRLNSLFILHLLITYYRKMSSC